jgi:alkylation response protein AidB-like acyl-CoA dehydrogenase
MALRVVEELARGEAVSMKVRLDAAKTLLDRAGHVPPRAAANDIRKIEMPLNEMSVEELKSLATRLEEELVDRAIVVSSVTGLPVEQLVDLMD